MKHEEVNPFGDDIVSPRADDFFEVSHFVRLQWQASDNSAVADRGNETIDNDKLCPGFTPLTLAMNMNWVVFVCVEHDDQTEVLVQLWHDDQSNRLIEES